MLIAAIIVAAATTLAVATGSSAGRQAQGGIVTVWLSGTYAGATPGSTYRKWLDGVKARYEKAYPGSKVKFVLTPINNAQFTAQIAAAFASRKVPDAMLVYSGGYTTPYMLSSLEKLNDRVRKSRASTASQSHGISRASTSTARAGRARSTRIPNDFGTSGSTTTRRSSRRQVIAKPPKTYNELLAAVQEVQAEGDHPARLRRP